MTNPSAQAIADHQENGSQINEITQQKTTSEATVKQFFDIKATKTESKKVYGVETMNAPY